MRVTAVILYALVALFFSSAARAQTITNVTGTVTDPNGIPYSNARMTVTLSIPGATVQVTNQQTCQSGGFGSQPCYIPISTTIGPLTLDSTGSFALAIYSNSGIYTLQQGVVTTQWNFNITISPGILLPFGTGPQQFSVAVTIAGASQDVSSTLSAAAPKLTNFAGSGAAASGTVTAFSYALNADTFTRANAGNLGTLWTAESGGTSGSPLQIVSNTAQPSSPTNNAASFWSMNTFANNQWAEAIVNTATSSGFGGAIVRASSGDNYYRCDWQLEAAGAGQVRIDKVVGGVFTALVSNTSLTGQTANSLIHLEASGTTLTCYINGTLVLTTTDSSLASGAPGVTAFLTTSTLVDFRGGDLIWTRQGTVIAVNQTHTSGTGNFEPSVIYDSGCQLVAGSQCFKMWHSDGWTVCNTDYAESLDGITWTENPSNPTITGACHGFETKIKGKYYAYTTNTATPPQAFDQWTSPDGLTWTKAHAGVLAAGPSTWDGFDIFNPFVFQLPGGTWMMFYDGSDSSVYSVGLASSPDGFTWIKDASNPLITNGAASVSSVDLHQIGSTYYAFVHTSPSGELPSDTSLYSSTDLHTWAASPRNPIVERTLVDEGANVSVGQLADPVAVEVNGTTYLFNDAGDAQASGVFHINLRTTPHPLADLLPASIYSCRCQ